MATFLVCWQQLVQLRRDAHLQQAQKVGMHEHPPSSCRPSERGERGIHYGAYTDVRWCGMRMMRDALVHTTNPPYRGMSCFAVLSSRGEIDWQALITNRMSVSGHRLLQSLQRKSQAVRKRGEANWNPCAQLETTFPRCLLWISRAQCHE